MQIPNLIQQREMLKNFSEPQIAQLVQNPTAEIPQFLVAAEIQRRIELRNAAIEAPNTTVVEDIANEGLGALQQQAAPQAAPEEAPMEEPEQIDQGIGGIPTQMAEVPAMAGGGIIAFDKGGDVPSILQSEKPTLEKRAREILMGKGKSFGFTQEDLVAAMKQAAIDLGIMPSGPSFLGMQGGPEPGGYVPTAADLAPPAQPKPTPDAPVAPDFNVPGVDLSRARKDIASAYDIADQRLAEAQGYKGQYADDVQAGLGMLKERAALAPDREQIAADVAKAYEGEPFAELKKYYEGRLGKVEGEKSKAADMGLLYAGLGIMGGTSPFAAANIGQGATKGVDYYVSRADKLEAAQDKYNQGLAEIAQAKRAEGIESNKEVQRRFERGQERMDNAQNTYTSVISNMNANDRNIVTNIMEKRASMGATKATTLADVDIKQASLQQTAAIANARVKMLERQITAQGANAAAKLAAVKQKALATMNDDPVYLDTKAKIKEKYNYSGGFSNPAAQAELKAAQDTFLANQIELLFGGGATALSADDLLGD